MDSSFNDRWESGFGWCCFLSTQPKPLLQLNSYKYTIILLHFLTMYHMMVNTGEFKKQDFPTVKTFL